MEIQVTQDVMDSECDRLPTICGAYSIKREESPTTDARVAESHPATCSEVLKYEEVTTEEFDVLSIKREDTTVDVNNLATHMDVLENEEIKIEEFDVLSLTREHSPTDDIPVVTNNLATCTDILEYEEIKIEEFDVDKALLERERAASSQPVGAGQVMSRYLTILCYEHLY